MMAQDCDNRREQSAGEIVDSAYPAISKFAQIVGKLLRVTLLPKLAARFARENERSFSDDLFALTEPGPVLKWNPPSYRAMVSS